MLSGENRVKLAQYHHRGGMRLKRCKAVGKVRGTLDALAEKHFEARDWSMGEARRLLDRRKLFRFSIVGLDFGRAVFHEFIRHDELEAGIAYEQSCESRGVDPGMYLLANKGRVRL